MSRAIPPTQKPKRKPRHQFHHGDLRAAAIALAVAMVEEQGHASLTLERIATKLGVTRPALYRHFADRRALISEVAQQGYERCEAALTEAFLSKQDPWESLLATGCAYTRYAIDNPGWFRLQFSTPPSERPLPDLQRAPPRYAMGMLNVLNDALGHGDPRVGRAYRGLMAVLHGLADLSIGGVFPGQDARTYADEVVAQHVAALRAFAEAAK